MFGSTATPDGPGEPSPPATLQRGEQAEATYERRLRGLLEPDDEETVEDKDQTPAQTEIAELRKQVAALKDQIKQKATQVKVQKAFAKRIEKLKNTYQLNAVQVKKLELAAKGAISRANGRSDDDYQWTEDLPDWAECFSWGEGYLYRDGDRIYFGERPRVFFASREAVWIKAVQSVLTEQERVQRKKTRDERRQFQHDAIARMGVVELDSDLKLTAKQRKEMVPVYTRFIADLDVEVGFSWLPILLRARVDEIPAGEVEKIFTPAQLAQWHEVLSALNDE